MNKTELVAAMAEQAGVSKKDAEKTLKAFTDVVAEELLLKYPREQQEMAEILRPARL